MEVGTHFYFYFDNGLVDHLVDQYFNIHRDQGPLDWYVVVVGQKFAHVTQNLCFQHFFHEKLGWFCHPGLYVLENALLNSFYDWLRALIEICSQFCNTFLNTSNVGHPIVECPCL